MKLSAFKEQLLQREALNFQTPGVELVPAHFHITEAGINSKHFIDCGGKIRTEKYINFQVWVADDTAHRLLPQKLLKIISASEKVLGDEDLEVEIEYQQETIGRYALESDEHAFILIPKYTNCLARESCGTPSTVVTADQINTCVPGTKGTGCC